MLRVVGGTYKRRLLDQPSLEVTRPTKDIAKEGLFNSLGDIQNKSFLDCFGGSGAIGIEAYSRGAKKVTIIEKNIEACKIIQKNLNSLKINDIEVINKDFFVALNFLKKTYEIVFIDPPYKMEINKDFLLKLFDLHIVDNDSIIILERDNVLNLEYFDNFNIKQLKYGKTYLYILRGIK